MSNINHTIKVTVTIAAAAAAVTGFGIQLIVPAAGTLEPGFTERYREYTSAEQAQNDADLSANAVAMVSTAFSQARKPTKVAVGRVEPAGASQVVTVTVAGTVANGEEFRVYVNGTLFTYTAVVPTDDDAAVATALVGLINGGAEPVTAADLGSGVFTVTSDVADTADNIEVYDDSTAATISRVYTTSAVDYATELAAISAENDSWYVVTLEARDGDAHLQLAAYVESRVKEYWGQTSDTTSKLANSGVIAELADLGYQNTLILWRSEDSEYSTTGWATSFFSVDPDRAVTTAASKEIVGSTPDTDDAVLTQTELTNVLNNGGNVYTRRRGLAETWQGRNVSGVPIDLILTAHWVTERISERVATLLHRESNKGSRVPYTDEGAGQVLGEGQVVLNDGVRIGHFVETQIENPAGADLPDLQLPYITADPVAAIGQVFKNSRSLPAEFRAIASGAIEGADIVGNIDISL